VPTRGTTRTVAEEDVISGGGLVETTTGVAEATPSSKAKRSVT